MSQFSDFALDSTLLQALEKSGYQTPTPIQQAAIPGLLEGRDLIGIAQTGTGKTASFALPILSYLSRNPKKMKPARVRVLVMAPTRELASQIIASFEKYSKELKGLRFLSVFGGVSERPQIQALAKGVDVLVATPGRLMDLMSHGHINVSECDVFVLDEADRMLDMGFIKDIERVALKLPEKRQTMLFSATMPMAIEKLAQKFLKDPLKVEVTPESTTVEKIEQSVLHVEKKDKIKRLKDYLDSERPKRILVFTRTKHGANRVVKELEKLSFKANAIHGNKSQGAREKALEEFRLGTVSILVATDIAARGIDIPGVGHVVNYDIPNDPESYVHRIGRTARAGKSGKAISFCDPEEESYLRSVEKVIRMALPLYGDSKPARAVSPMSKPLTKPKPKTANKKKYYNRGKAKP